MRRLVDSLLLVLIVYSVTWPVLRGFGATGDGAPTATSAGMTVVAAGEEAAPGTHVVALLGVRPGTTYRIVVEGGTEGDSGPAELTTAATGPDRLRVAISAAYVDAASHVTVLDGSGTMLADEPLCSGPRTEILLSAPGNPHSDADAPAAESR